MSWGVHVTDSTTGADGKRVTNTVASYALDNPDTKAVQEIQSAAHHQGDPSRFDSNSHLRDPKVATIDPREGSRTPVYRTLSMTTPEGHEVHPTEVGALLTGQTTHPEIRQRAIERHTVVGASSRPEHFSTGHRGARA
jgi:hypothetical protein